MPTLKPTCQNKLKGRHMNNMLTTDHKIMNYLTKAAELKSPTKWCINLSSEDYWMFEVHTDTEHHLNLDTWEIIHTFSESEADIDPDTWLKTNFLRQVEHKQAEAFEILTKIKLAAKKMCSLDVHLTPNMAYFEKYGHTYEYHYTTKVFFMDGEPQDGGVYHFAANISAMLFNRQIIDFAAEHSRDTLKQLDMIGDNYELKIDEWLLQASDWHLLRLTGPKTDYWVDSLQYVSIKDKYGTMRQLMATEAGTGQAIRIQ